MRILTFDLEEWFHLLDLPETADPRGWSRFESRFEESLERILGLLLARKQTATFFCLGWIAERYPDTIRRLSDLGFEIGSHSHLHSLVYTQTPAEFEAELVQSLDKLEAATGARPRIFRAPGFSITEATPWAFDVLVRHGIEIDCSIFPARRAHGGIAGFAANTPHRIETPSGALKSFPINTRRLLGFDLAFTGGGYFRLLPGSLIARWAEDAPYVMTYFHPRDFDPDQPVLPGLSLPRRFKAYVGLDGAISKLERLLDEPGRFTDVTAADQAIDWTSVPTVAVG